MEKQTVLITGATSGIGLELAKLFAKDKYDMIILSRDEQHLKETAEELKSLGAGDIHFVAQDLGEPGSAKRTYDAIQKKGLRVDVLVNDAGVGEFGYFTETDIERELHIVQLNVISLMELTKYFLVDMEKRNSGKILQLGSVAGYQPTPKLSVYAATKSFVNSFSDAIGYELKEKGSKVTITTLLPNATDTDFFRKAGMEHTKAAQDNPEDPAAVAKAGYEALMNGDAHGYGSGVKQQIVMSGILPNRKIADMANEQMKEMKNGNGNGHSGNGQQKKKENEKALK